MTRQFNEQALRAELPPWVAIHAWEKIQDDEVEGWVLTEEEITPKDFEIWLGSRDETACVWTSGSQFWIHIDSHYLFITLAKELPTRQNPEPEIWWMEYDYVEDEHVLHIHHNVIVNPEVPNFWRLPPSQQKIILDKVRKENSDEE